MKLINTELKNNVLGSMMRILDERREDILTANKKDLDAFNKDNQALYDRLVVNDKKIDGISEIRDESDRKGMRIVYELKRDSIPNVVLNKLYKYTSLQSSFSVNNIALVKGKPELLNLHDMIVNFVEHRHEVVVRRTQYELGKAEERAHILEGLIIALDNIDAVIKLIRASKSPEEARKGLMEKFELSEVQSKAILDMRLQKLTGLEREKLRAEYDDLKKLISDLKDILANKDKRMNIIKTELQEVKEKFGGLRFYVQGSDDFIDGIIDLAESMSYRICSECGNQSTPQKNRGWIYTLCDSCR